MTKNSVIIFMTLYFKFFENDKLIIKSLKSLMNCQKNYFDNMIVLLKIWNFSYFLYQISMDYFVQFFLLINI